MSTATASVHLQSGFNFDTCERKTFEYYQEGNGMNYSSHSQYMGHQPPQLQQSQKALLKSLFGTDVNNWPFTEDSFQKAMDLRIQQEKTKQEYYKTEALNRSIELIKLATISKIPGYLIPTLFGVSEDSILSLTSKKEKLNLQSISKSVPASSPIATPNATSNATPNTTPNPTVSTPSRRTYHSRGKTISNISELDQPFLDTKPNLKNPMSNFKFGAGSSNSQLISQPRTQHLRTSLAPKHQLSPSRIGAHAISSLTTSGKLSTNIHNLKHGLNHQRTFSLPNNVSIPESKSIEFNRSNTNFDERNTENLEIIIPDLSQQDTPKKRKINQMKFENNSIIKEEDENILNLSILEKTPSKNNYRNINVDILDPKTP